MDATKTYTNRNNARRAGVAAGIPAELVEITVHKNGDEVRFGWKEMAPAPVVTTSKPKKAPVPKVERTERVEQNGVKRPAPGGLCAAVWEYLDKHPKATAKDLREVAPSKDWNVNNVACEFYQWRKFNGITGRTAAA